MTRTGRCMFLLSGEHLEAQACPVLSVWGWCSMGWGCTPGRTLVLSRQQTSGSFTATWELRAFFPQSFLRGLEIIATLTSGRATGNLGSDLAWGSSSTPVTRLARDSCLQSAGSVNHRLSACFSPPSAHSVPMGCRPSQLSLPWLNPTQIYPSAQASHGVVLVQQMASFLPKVWLWHEALLFDSLCVVGASTKNPVLLVSAHQNRPNSYVLVLWGSWCVSQGPGMLLGLYRVGQGLYATLEGSCNSLNE